MNPYPWPPEPQFMKFLENIEKNAGDTLPKEAWVMIMEIRAGSPLGRMFYDNIMEDEKMREIYEDWKALEDDSSQGP